MAKPKNAQLGAKPATDAQGPVSAKNNNNNNEASGTRLVDTLLTLLIPGLILAHLVIAPYTKVEESFNIQAAHDVLVYGTPTSHIHHKLTTTYDHFTFPGAVPRTFIGPVLLAGFAQPIVALVGFQHAQFVVRAILGLFNAACLLTFARNLRRAYGAGTARCYLLLQASQFHIIFYASRTLPNMFAFGLTTLGFAFILPNPANPKSTARRQRLSITMFVFAAAVFRSEVALLLGATILHQLIIPTLSVERVVFPFTTSFLTALMTSIPIDSYFWQRPLWPELWGFYYNVVRGSASSWGVSPWHYYFTSALPRLLINPLTYTLLIPYALYHPALRRATSRLLIPSLLFTALYSLQPHKETRFIFYTVPPLTAAAALAANTLFARRRKSLTSTLLAAALALSILASFTASTAMLSLSALNYPGGEALAHLRTAILSSPSPSRNGASIQQQQQPEDGSAVLVHADVLACMTGVTLFTTSTAASINQAAAVGVAHLPDPPSSSSSSSDSPSASSGGGGSNGGGGGPVIVQQHHHHQQDGSQTSVVRIVVDKTEDATLLRSADFWRQFAYVLTEDPGKVVGGLWEAVGVVQGYAGIEVLKPGEENAGRGRGAPVVGMGRMVALWKRRVRAVTGGWWVGPRMVERVYILRRVKDVEMGRVAVEAR